uniref:CCHC-type domain-containing protein n=1 Tax=Heligmosomoides polygyrus TaxID=6339 RepID=A0A183FR06_HELPZ
LSRDCEQNAHGIYPDGGSCNVCGSTKHLKRDCPELAEQKQKQLERKATVFYPKMMELWVPPCLDPIIGPYDGEVKVRVMSAMSSADAEDVLDDNLPKDNLETKPKKKIVKF